MNRLEQYQKILEEFGIDPEDDSYSGGEDALQHVSGVVPLKRYCVVTQGGGFIYAKAIWNDLQTAKEAAVENIHDDIFSESPIAIIDLDTGERLEPDFKSIQWTTAVVA